MAQPQIDLSFSRYVAARKGEASARSREGAVYAYSGDLKVRAALDRVRPVTLAVEATVRLWQSVEKSRMLGTAVKVTDKQFPRVWKLGVKCAEILRIPIPTLYVSPNIGSLNAHTFGTTDDPYIVVNAALIDHLSELELLDVIGHECGHIQNNHVVYMTTLYFLTRAANMFLRWSVKPAVLALNAWARRAEITCDRTGLLCTRDLDVSIGCLVKLAIGSRKLYSDINLDEYLAQLDEAQRGPGRFDELRLTHPYLPKRVAALRLFASTSYFRSVVAQGDKRGPGQDTPSAGISKQECDAKVAELLSIFAMTTLGTNSGQGNVAERKAAIRAVLDSLAAAAEAAGLASTAADIRTTRIPKLDEERFTLVVLGEFNHGKSTFVNALLGEAILPAGITPTTAVLTHVSHDARAGATLVFESGQRQPIGAAALTDWLTVEGREAADGKSNGAPGATSKAPAGDAATALHHVEITHPAPILENRLTIVDTPGVNDINEQRADITYGYVPRADAAIFLLDGTQILTASERQFLEERILRSARDRLIFVIAKSDLLDAGELAETIAFARKHLGAIVAEPAIFPVSAKRALAGDRDGSGMTALVRHLGATVGQERRRLLLDHALADAGRLSMFVRQSLGMRRRSLELATPDLEQRIVQAKERLARGKKLLGETTKTITAETAALKARVRQDLAAFASDMRDALAPEIDKVDAADIRRYLGFFVQDTWKAWVEAEGEMIAAELERLAEKVIQVANENVREIAHDVSAVLGPAETKIDITVDTLKYDASVFALGALGTTVFLFVNGVVGGLLTLAAPVLAFILRGRVGQEIKTEAKESAPAAVDRVAALLGPKLDEMIDAFAARLAEFVAEAGDALARGIAEVLDRALRERVQHGQAIDAQPEAAAIDAAVLGLKAIDERIADIRQRVWLPEEPEAAPPVTPTPPAPAAA